MLSRCWQLNNSLAIKFDFFFDIWICLECLKFERKSLLLLLIVCHTFIFTFIVTLCRSECSPLWKCYVDLGFSAVCWGRALDMNEMSNRDAIESKKAAKQHFYLTYETEWARQVPFFLFLDSYLTPECDDWNRDDDRWRRWLSMDINYLPFVDHFSALVLLYYR